MFSVPLTRALRSERKFSTLALQRAENILNLALIHRIGTYWLSLHPPTTPLARPDGETFFGVNTLPLKL